MMHQRSSFAVAGPSQLSRTPNLKWAIWPCCILLLLLAETTILGFFYGIVISNEALLPIAAVHFRAILGCWIAAIAASILLGWQALFEELQQSSNGTAAWPKSQSWLSVHLVIVVLLLVWSSAPICGWMADSHEGVLWLTVWLTSASLVLLSWCAALIPPSIWVRWIVRNPTAIVYGVLAGVLARIAGRYLDLSWKGLERPTFVAATALLRLAGRHPTIDYQKSIIKVGSFSAQVAPACSGLEGIGLISVFVAAYIIFFRRELRFPNVLLLLPVGVVSAWSFNALRIAVLLELGSFQQNLAVHIFHSLAGWLYFCLLAGVIVFVSNRMSFFTRGAPVLNPSLKVNPASKYILPFLVVIAASMVTAPFSSGFDKLYPLRVIATGAAIFFYWTQFEPLLRPVSVWPVAVGVVTFLVWICLVRASHGPQDAVFAKGLASLSAPMAAGWLIFRIIGAVLTVPIAEELAFRGYLLRKLIDFDFEKVAPGQFTLMSFLLSSLLFGLLHQQWIAGTISGMLFAISLYGRGRLSDAILSHATTNAMLAVYVLATQQWWLWN
jgi:exosortase E/protease (VPEID-CTERM system)